MRIRRDFIYDSSLVLYLPLWKLDGSSFMSKDAYGHLCTVTGATWSKQGRIVDGTDDKLALSDTDASSPLNFTTSDFTLEMWLKFDDLDGIQVLWSKGVNADTGYYFDKRSDGGGSIYVSTDTVGVTTNGTFITGILALTWTHLFIVKKGTTVTVYKGLTTGGLTAYTSAVVFQNPESSIQASKWGVYGTEAVGNWFDGGMGEIRAYNR